MEDATTILFGLPGVGVQRAEVADGGRLVHVETADVTAAACPECGVFSTSVKQYRVTRPRDLPYGETPLRVRWHKRQYRCLEPACARRAFTESIAELPPRARVSGRCRRAAAVAVGSGRSVSAVGVEYGISWPTVHAGYADGLLAEPEPVAVLGIDETRRGRPRWRRDEDGRWVKLDRFETNFVTRASQRGSSKLRGQRRPRAG